MSTPTIEKRGFTLGFSWESLLGNHRKGHREPAPITEEDARLHAQARAALEVLENNPWIEWFYDDVSLKPLEKHVWVYDETEEEHHARIRTMTEGVTA